MSKAEVVEVLKALSKRWQGFAETQEMARYELFSQTVFSDRFEKKDVDAIEKTTQLHIYPS